MIGLIRIDPKIGIEIILMLEYFFFESENLAIIKSYLHFYCREFSIVVAFGSFILLNISSC